LVGDAVKVRALPAQATKVFALMATEGAAAGNTISVMLFEEGCAGVAQAALLVSWHCTTSPLAGLERVKVLPPPGVG
jgi:hypothetical protein